MNTNPAHTYERNQECQIFKLHESNQNDLFGHSLTTCKGQLMSKTGQHLHTLPQFSFS